MIAVVKRSLRSRTNVCWWWSGCPLLQHAFEEVFGADGINAQPSAALTSRQEARWKLIADEGLLLDEFRSTFESSVSSKIATGRARSYATATQNVEQNSSDL
jgi:hypothetical protein